MAGLALVACMSLACAAEPSVPCMPEGGAPHALVVEAGRLAAEGRRAAGLLLLQRRLAEVPADCRARAAMLALLGALEAPPAAYEVPGNAVLGGRPWLDRVLSGARSGAWIALEFGHDSNFNSATSLGNVDLPLLNYRSLALNPVLVRRASPFVGLDGGVMASRPLSATAAVSATLQAAARYNTGEPDYLPAGYFGALAAEQHWGRVRVEGELVYLQRRLGRYRVIDRWQQAVTLALEPLPGWRLAAWLSAAGNRYPLFNAVDTREQGAGLRLAHAGSGLTLSFNGGRERSSGPLKDLDRDYAGVTLDWSRKFGTDGTFALRLGETRSNYTEPSPLFLTQRADRWRELSVAYRHRLGHGWSLTPRLVVEENGSTIPVVAFRRHQALLELRRDW